MCFSSLFYLSQESMKAETSFTVSVLGKISIMRKMLNGNFFGEKKMNNVFFERQLRNV